ncbi:hypothetical protein ACFWWT_40275 [Streptomyces sp. NPDC058676]|uniref:hypothetical protein n=1 Tax=unclassified Streptomyces TaxID=2593676 RepID=UPI003651CFAD
MISAFAILRYAVGPTTGGISKLRHVVPARAFDRQLRTLNRPTNCRPGSKHQDQSNGSKEKHAADAVIRDDGEKPDGTPYTPQSDLVDLGALLRWARAAWSTATPHTEGDAAGLTQVSSSPSTATSGKS